MRSHFVEGKVIDGLEIIKVLDSGTNRVEKNRYIVECSNCKARQEVGYSGLKNRKTRQYSEGCVFCWRSLRPKVSISPEEALKKKQRYWKTARGKIRKKMEIDPEYAEKIRNQKRKKKEISREEWPLNRIRNLKYRAKLNGVAWEPDASDGLFIPDVCPVLGIPLVIGKNHLSMNSPSVDRIIPEKGYVKGNVQIISQLANGMKQNASPETLLKFAEWVINTYAT